VSNSTQPPPLSSVTISCIVDSAHNAFRRDFLSNLMVASNDLKDMAQRAFNQGVEAHSSSSTMDSADAWVVESQKTELKKLRTIPNTIRSIFKDVGRSAVDLALPISEWNKELVHRKAYIDSLCIDFAYLDDPDTISYIQIFRYNCLQSLTWTYVECSIRKPCPLSHNQPCIT
jgi:hypothetical protein